MSRSIDPLLHPAPSGALLRRDWILALILFVAGTLLFLRHNDFPSYYHPDEPSKARQLVEGEYNFNHPLLLLQATALELEVRQSPLTQQSVAEAGRDVSAVFAGATVALGALIAASLGGSLAGLVAGLLLLTNHHLYELAHYMKEDPALVFGMAVFFLGVVLAWQRPTRGHFILMGAGAALALSGKYIGALVLPVAVVLLWRRATRREAVAAGLAFLVVLLAVNYPMLDALREMTGNVSREMDYAVHGHKGLTRSVPHGVYGAVFREATNPLIWVLLAVYYARFLWRWRETSAAERAVAIFPLVFVLILSFSPKTHHRYFLPDTFLLLTLAGLTVAGWRETWQRAVMGTLAAGAIVWSTVQVAAEDASFQNDARRALVAYVQEHIPADAVIVQDKRVNLPSRDNKRHADSSYFLDQTLLGKLFAADVGTIEELRARGIHYVAVSDGDYGRFFLKTHTPRPEEREEYERRKRFYEELFAQGRIIWQCEAGPQQYLQPEIKLYYLP